MFHACALCVLTFTTHYHSLVFPLLFPLLFPIPFYKLTSLKNYLGSTFERKQGMFVFVGWLVSPDTTISSSIYFSANGMILFSVILSRRKSKTTVVWNND